MLGADHERKKIEAEQAEAAQKRKADAAARPSTQVQFSFTPGLQAALLAGEKAKVNLAGVLKPRSENEPYHLIFQGAALTFNVFRIFLMI